MHPEVAEPTRAGGAVRQGPEQLPLPGVLMPPVETTVQDLRVLQAIERADVDGSAVASGSSPTKRVPTFTERRRADHPHHDLTTAYQPDQRAENRQAADKVPGS